MPSIHGSARLVQDFMMAHMPQGTFFMGLANLLDEDFSYMEEGLPDAICDKNGYLALIKNIKKSCPDLLISPHRKAGPSTTNFDFQLHGADFVTVVDLSATFSSDTPLSILDLPPLEGRGAKAELKNQRLKIYVDVESNKVERVTFAEGHGWLTLYEQLGGDVPNYPLQEEEKGSKWSFNPNKPPGGTASFIKEEREPDYRHTTAKNTFSIQRAKPKHQVPRWESENKATNDNEASLKLDHSRALDERAIYEGRERARLEKLYKERQQKKIDAILELLNRAIIDKSVEGIENQVIAAMKLKPMYNGPEIEAARQKIIEIRVEERKKRLAEVKAKWQKAEHMLVPLNAFLQQRSFTSFLTEYLSNNRKDHPDDPIVKVANIVLQNPSFPKRGPLRLYVQFMKATTAPKQAVNALKQAFNKFAPFQTWIEHHSGDEYQSLLAELDDNAGEDLTLDEYAKLVSKEARNKLAAAQAEYAGLDHGAIDDSIPNEELDALRELPHEFGTYTSEAPAQQGFRGQKAAAPQAPPTQTSKAAEADEMFSGTREQQDAAAKIQAGFRGKQAREQVAKMKAETEDDNDDDDEELAAAQEKIARAEAEAAEAEAAAAAAAAAAAEAAESEAILAAPVSNKSKGFKEWLINYAESNPEDPIAKLAKVAKKSDKFPDDGSTLDYVKFLKDTGAPMPVIKILEKSFSKYAPFKQYLLKIDETGEAVPPEVEKFVKLAQKDGSFPEEGTIDDYMAYFDSKGAPPGVKKALKGSFKQYSIKKH